MSKQTGSTKAKLQPWITWPPCAGKIPGFGIISLSSLLAAKERKRSYAFYLPQSSSIVIFHRRVV
jgi:hypothetical protein